MLGFGIAILRGAGALPRLTQVDRRDERLDTRFGTAQLLAAEGLLGEARAELQVLHPVFEERYGRESVHVRNLERQADRLRHPDAL